MLISKKLCKLVLLLIPICFLFSGCKLNDNNDKKISTDKSFYTIDNVPDFSGEPYIAINNNVPYFSDSDYTTKAFENYSGLDRLGRCGIAYACVCKETMPTEKRGSIGQVKPSGWHTEKYDIIEGKYLYNRCHLIGYQLTGENANENNLITGTRYLNIEGMLPFENMVVDYVKETNNHVLYRVTPVFDKNNLVARGVEIEAFSIEDMGDGISFNIYAYNNQPGITIDYSTGKSSLTQNQNNYEKTEYILNTKTKKYHLTSCNLTESIAEKNKKTYEGKPAELEQMGYSPCGKCIE